MVKSSTQNYRILGVIPLGSKRLYNYKTTLCSFSAPPTGTAPPAATVIIVVCIAALVTIVVIGVYRIHATHQEGSREDEEEVKEADVDWENSALTIIVNPMEVTETF